MGKSAQAFLKDADSNDFGAPADMAAEKSSTRVVAEGAKSAKSAKSARVARIDGSAVCTMSEAEIRQRLDAFAKELARAQRERSQH